MLFFFSTCLQMSQVKIISWKVCGLNAAVKRSLVFKFLQKHKPHVCILQETHLQGSKINGLRKPWVSEHFHATYSNYSHGVSILIQKALPFQVLEVSTDQDGRYIILHVSIYNKKMVLVGLYLPPPASVSILNDIMNMVLWYDTPAILLLGDFNMVPCPDLDRLQGKP